jgi:hypothetical protein
MEAAPSRRRIQDDGCFWRVGGRGAHASIVWAHA